MLNESWSKSSYSAGADCVEAGWHKASASALSNCVEVGQGGCGMVRVRDTKDRDGGELAFSPGAWMQFLETLK